MELSFIEFLILGEQVAAALGYVAEKVRRRKGNRSVANHSLAHTWFAPCSTPQLVLVRVHFSAADPELLDLSCYVASKSPLLACTSSESCQR